MPSWHPTFQRDVHLVRPVRQIVKMWLSDAQSKYSFRLLDLCCRGSQSDIETQLMSRNWYRPSGIRYLLPILGYATYYISLARLTSRHCPPL